MEQQTEQTSNEPKQTKRKFKFNKKTMIIAVVAFVAIVSLMISLIVFITRNNTDDLEIATDPAPAVVIIKDDGFDPQTIKISKDTIVIWENNTGVGKRIAAEPYPSGDSLPELDSIELIPPEENYAYLFSEVGTYNYYDFSDPTNIKGTIIVE